MGIEYILHSWCARNFWEWPHAPSSTLSISFTAALVMFCLGNGHLSYMIKLNTLSLPRSCSRCMQCGFFYSFCQIIQIWPRNNNRIWRPYWRDDKNTKAPCCPHTLWSSFKPTSFHVLPCVATVLKLQYKWMPSCIQDNRKPKVSHNNAM